MTSEDLENSAKIIHTTVRYFSVILSVSQKKEKDMRVSETMIKHIQNKPSNTELDTNVKKTKQCRCLY